MGLHIVIDGYNFIGAWSRLYRTDLEEERSSLIRDLSIYRKLKGAKITLVFDGKRSGRSTRNREVRHGITVIYSREGEEADTIIKEIAREKGHGVTVVTSDRDVASYAGSCGAVVLRSGEFSEILETALYADLKGEVPEDGEGEGGRRKKGQGKRPPKERRRKFNRLKKL